MRNDLIQRGKTHKNEGKRGSHIHFRLPKVLHSFGKVAVRELAYRFLAMVCCGEKTRKGGASHRVNKIISENTVTPIPHYG